MARKRRAAPPADPTRIAVYTDGGCDPNPGRGGWGVVIVQGRRVVRELSGGEDETTNNRMELTAAVQGLAALPEGSRVALHTDSMYVRNGISEWISAWRARGWKTTDGQDVKNKDLWCALDAAALVHDVQWHWVRGHAGNEFNERADRLAAAAIHNGRRREVHAKAAASSGTPALVELFAAASHAAKPDRGAWAVVLRYGDVTRVLSGQVAGASANRMGLVAVIEGLRALKRPVPVRIFAANDYIVDGVTRWLDKWKGRNWRTADGKEVGNRDLWEQLAALLRADIEWVGTGGVDPPAPMQEAKAAATAALHRG
jgi:ribonuclease HI